MRDCSQSSTMLSPFAF